MPLPLGPGRIIFLGCPCLRASVGPSVHLSEARNTLFPPVHGSVAPSDQPWLFFGLSVCPSVGIGFWACRRTHGGNGLKFCILMYPHRFQNWLDYGHGLLIFLLLATLLLSETGQIWGFRAFLGERVEEMARNCAYWCILITFRAD